MCVRVIFCQVMRTTDFHNHWNSMVGKNARSKFGTAIGFSFLPKNKIYINRCYGVSAMFKLPEITCKKSNGRRTALS
jgi:hypothetical protein